MTGREKGKTVEERGGKCCASESLKASAVPVMTFDFKQRTVRTSVSMRATVVIND